MEEVFEKQLKEYGNHIKKGESASEFFDQPAQNIPSDMLDIQKQIFDLQLKKQQVMGELHGKLDLINTPGHSLEQKVGGRVKVVTYRDGKYFATSRKKNIEEEITLGDIFVAPEWGVRYAFDAESIPKKIRKRFHVERAKVKLRQLLKEQLIINAISDNKLPQNIKHTYEKTYADLRRGENQKIGLRSERLVESFLKKTIIDNAMDFTVEEADVIDDVEGKIDFVIKHRGSEGKMIRTGVQITINDNPKTLAKKSLKIETLKRGLGEDEKVNDIVFVALPYQEEFRDLFKKWRAMEGDVYKGPYALLTQEQQKSIFAIVLKDILTQEEIEKYVAEF